MEYFPHVICLLEAIQLCRKNSYINWRYFLQVNMIIMLALWNQTELWVIPIISSGYKREVIHDITRLDKLMGPKEDDFRKPSWGKKEGHPKWYPLRPVFEGKFSLLLNLLPPCVYVSTQYSETRHLKISRVQPRAQNNLKGKRRTGTCVLLYLIVLQVFKREREVTHGLRREDRKMPVSDNYNLSPPANNKPETGRVGQGYN